MLRGGRAVVTQNNRQPALFAEPAAPLNTTVGRQGDIVYLGRDARSVLNAPESTGMPYWSLNPYVGCAFGCAYCYARYAHRYVREREEDLALREQVGGAESRHPSDDAGLETAGSPTDAMPAWLAFERRIYVKQDAARLVSSDLRRGQTGRHAKTARLLRGEPLVIGTATDPYQPAERHFRVTRRVLEALAEYRGLRIVLITKSALVTRDIDVLTRLATRSRFTVHLSLITLDRDLARRIEPRAPTPEARLRALRRLRDGGIDVGINVMPVLPGLTDRPGDLAGLVAAVAAAGATHVNSGALRLQSEARRRYLPFIESEFPQLAARYHATYAHSQDVGQRYRAGLSRVVRKLCDRSGIRYGRFDEDRRSDTSNAQPGVTDEQLDVGL
jgi:DNA repair photolyase